MPIEPHAHLLACLYVPAEHLLYMLYVLAGHEWALGVGATLYGVAYPVMYYAVGIYPILPSGYLSRCVVHLVSLYASYAIATSSTRHPIAKIVVKNMLLRVLVHAA